MSNYYKYNFISPEPTFALVKEELKSYFNTGSVDDLLFPKWTEKCLKKLGKGTLKIEHTILYIEDYESMLPVGFDSVREAWMCHVIKGPVHTNPSALYQSVTTNITPTYDKCDKCDPCLPKEIQTTYKTTDSVTSNSHKITHLLKPGNINSKQNCSPDCLNYYSSSHDSFDVRDGKFVTNFRQGTVYLLYYSLNYDDNGFQLVPDEHRALEYIEYYIKWKVFEMLSNQITDETYNQITQKKQEAKILSDEALIMAQIEAKKQSVYKRMMSIKRDMNRNSIFNLDNRKWPTI